MTDCKAIELIFNNPKSKPPACVKCWNLRQGYDFEVQHTKGNENPSDYLSRHTSLVGDNKQTTMAEKYVNLLTSSAVPKAMTLQEIQKITTEDATLQCLMHLTRTQEWHNLDKLPEQFKDADITELRLFKQVKDDLTINDQ